MGSSQRVTHLRLAQRAKTTVMQSKLDQHTYWFAQYGFPSGESDQEILSGLLDSRVQAMGVNVWWFWVHGKTTRDATTIKRVLKLAADRELYFWLTLSGEGVTLYNHPLNVFQDVLADESIRKYFLGLAVAEPPAAPSLYHGHKVTGRWAWLDRQHLRIPTAVYEQSRGSASEAFDKVGFEFTAEGGAHIEPLPKPIENPVEAMDAWRQAYQRWHKPYLDLLREDESLTIMGWEGSNSHIWPGYYNIKAAMALDPFRQIVLQTEINNFDYAPVLAQARGLSRTNDIPVWGVWIGAVGYKYSSIYEQLCDRPHTEKSDYIEYFRSTLAPGWYVFTPATFSWSGGGRYFLHESTDVQITGNSHIAKAYASFKDFLAGDPMQPETRLALLKGNAYFSGDIPGYENGMWEELDTAQLYVAGKRNDRGRSVHALPIPAMIWPQSMQDKAWGNRQFLSGNPYGEADILPSHCDGQLLAQYDKVVMVEWNDLTDDFYLKLKAFVDNGGHLFLAGAHLFSNQVGLIDWQSPGSDQFFRDGQLGEFCGVEFTGGVISASSQLVWNGNNTDIFYPGAPIDVDQVHLYPVRLAKNGQVVAALTDGTPAVVRRPVGRGWVYTVLGPSYTLALRQAYEPFFRRVLEHNRRQLSYRVDRVLAPERETLYVTRDRGSRRFALCNTWHFFDPTPRLTLRDIPAGEYALEVICHDVKGRVGQWSDTTRHWDPCSTQCTVPAHGAAVVHWRSQRRNKFKLSYRLMHAWEIYGCGSETSSSTTVQIGDVQIFIKRDPIDKDDILVNDRDVPCDITITITNRQVQPHNLHVKVQDPTGRMMVDEHLTATPKANGHLAMEPGCFGKVTGDWLVNISQE